MHVVRSISRKKRKEIFMRYKTSGILWLIVFLAVILFICTSTSTLHSQPQQGPGKGIAYIDCHNHLAGRYGSPGGVEGQDYEGAAREKRAVQFTLNSGIMGLRTLYSGGRR
jgi:hypothetical protein